MSKKNAESFNVIHNLVSDEHLETTIQSLNKNVIILSHNIRLKNNTRKSTQIWLYRLEKLFKDLGDDLCDTEKINIALRSADDELFERIIAKQLTCYSDFQHLVLDGKTEINAEKFKVNEWVQIYDESASIYDKDSYETGIVIKVCENGLYEVACKDKALKIHGKYLSKI